MTAILYYVIIIIQLTPGNSSFLGKYKSVIASSSYRELQAKPEFVLVIYTWLYGFEDFAIPCILLMACPTLSLDQTLLAYCLVNIFLVAKANPSLTSSRIHVYLNYLYLQTTLHSHDYDRDIRWTLSSTPGPLLLTYHAHKINGLIKASQECEQILLKPHYSCTSTATSSQQPLYISGLSIQWNPTLQPSHYYDPILSTQTLESWSDFIILKTPLTPPHYDDQDFLAQRLLY